jgi:hypothetical protein
MLRKTDASDFENTENLNSPFSQEKKSCKVKYFILPMSHALCVGLGIYIGIIINDWGDGSL